MNEQQLVEHIAQEVIRRIVADTQESNITARGKILVLGDADKLNKRHICSKPLFMLDDYCKYNQIEQYDSIYILDLSRAQLCDLAAARDEGSGTYTGAVLGALLRKIPVFLAEEALTYRIYCDTAPPELIAQYEHYLKTLLSYGVTLFSNADTVKNKTETVFDITEKVITGSIAEKLLHSSERPLRFSPGTIVTPMAKDVFNKGKLNYKIMPSSGRVSDDNL